jgi:hypothetical protein
MNADASRSKGERSRYPTKASIARVVQGAKAGGLKVTGIIIKPDGSVEIREQSGGAALVQNEMTIDEALATWEIQHGLARGS